MKRLLYFFLLFKLNICMTLFSAQESGANSSLKERKKQFASQDELNKQLWHAAAKNNWQEVERRAEQGADINYICPKIGVTALAAAVSRCDDQKRDDCWQSANMVETLVCDLKADPFAGPHPNMTAFSYAQRLNPRIRGAQKGYIEWVRRMITEIAVENTKKRLSDSSEPSSCSRCRKKMRAGQGVVTVTPRKAHGACLKREGSTKRVVCPVSEIWPQ